MLLLQLLVFLQEGVGTLRMCVHLCTVSQMILSLSCLSTVEITMRVMCLMAGFVSMSLHLMGFRLYVIHEVWLWVHTYPMVISGSGMIVSPLPMSRVMSVVRIGAFLVSKLLV